MTADTSQQPTGTVQEITSEAQVRDLSVQPCPESLADLEERYGVDYGKHLYR